MKPESSLDRITKELAEDAEKEEKQRRYDEAFDAMREALEQLRYCTRLSIDSIVSQGKEALAKADAARPKEMKTELMKPKCMDLTKNEFMAGLNIEATKTKRHPSGGKP